MVTGFVDRVKGKSVIATQYQATGSQYYGSAQDSMTAAGTTSQANATQLNNSINRVTTVAANSGVRLPPALAGASITVIHAAITNALLVWPTGSDTINGTTNFSITAAGAGVGKVATFYAASNGIWHALLSS